jgi:hypothetical protein
MSRQVAEVAPRRSPPGAPVRVAGISLLEGAPEVIALHLQSIERSCLPLNKGFHLDQPGQELQATALDRQLVAVARPSPACRLLMTVPGIGAVTALSYTTISVLHGYYPSKSML